jgi:hypothetical protein
MEAICFFRSWKGSKFPQEAVAEPPSSLPAQDCGARCGTDGNV